MFLFDFAQVMTKICREAEASLDYYNMFKNILKQAPLPMSPLESLASSAVRTAHKVGTICFGCHAPLLGCKQWCPSCLAEHEQQQ